MRSLYQFIITPLEDRYDNIKQVGDKEFIINTTIENHSFVSKRGRVVAIPSGYKTLIKVGDEVIVHHNIFRRWYDQKGRERNSALYFKDDLYFCSPDQIYLYKENSEYKTHLNYCFVKPLVNKSTLTTDKEISLRGILKYTNNSLERLGLNPGALITFKPNSEFEFHIGDERLYCMKSNDIVIEHERKGNEEEYNPSWANSG
tara:strand:+ start:18 stop:623 length:606 start_codon:yes stop_codon:yes gene_type:complete